MIKNSPSIALIITTAEKAAPLINKQPLWVCPADSLKYDSLLRKNKNHLLQPPQIL